MLKAFRDNLKYLSWVLWGVILIFVLFVFVDFGAGVPGGTPPSQAAATLGRQAVSYGEFERSYRQAEDFYRRAYGQQFTAELTRQIGLPLQVLDGLIADKIVLEEARRMGLKVTDEEVRRQILQQPGFQDLDGSFIGQEVYNDILRSNGYRPGEFEATVRSQLLTGKVREVLSENLYVSDDEIADAYREGVERAKIRFVELPADRFAAEVKLTEADLHEYFESHRRDYRIPEQRVVDYLLLEPSLLRATLAIDEEEIRAYYDEHVDEFREEERVHARHILLKVDRERSDEEAVRQLEAIRRRIEAGEDFAALASQVSEDPGSKSRGGELGFFGRGQMIREFEEAAFSAAPGDLVGPVLTNFGYHLIEVLDRREAGRRPLEEVRERIRDQLLSLRATSLAESRAQELAERIEREGLDAPEQMRALADTEEGITFHTTPPFGREDNVSGIGRATAFSVAAFELEPGKVSDAVRVARGWAVLQLREVHQPRLPDLDEGRQEVERAVRETRQLELARQRLQEGRATAAESGIDALAAELELEVEESPEFGRRGSIGRLGVQAQLAAEALSLEVGEVAGPLLLERSALLFEVVERKVFDPAAFEREKDEIRSLVRQERLDRMLNALVARRREELEVRYDTQLLRNFDLLPDDQT